MIRYLFTLLVLTLTNLSAAESMKLTLSEAVRVALAQNRVLKITRLKVVESEQKKAAAKSSYFPEIKNQSMAGHTTAQGNIEIPAGAFGVIPNAGLVPTGTTLKSGPGQADALIVGWRRPRQGISVHARNGAAWLTVG